MLVFTSISNQMNNKITIPSGPSPTTFSPTSAFARQKTITINSSLVSQVRPLYPQQYGRRASQWSVGAPQGCSQMETTLHQAKHSTNWKACQMTSKQLGSLCLRPLEPPLLNPTIIRVALTTFFAIA